MSSSMKTSQCPRRRGGAAAPATSRGARHRGRQRQRQRQRQGQGEGPPVPWRPGRSAGKVSRAMWIGGAALVSTGITRAAACIAQRYHGAPPATKGLRLHGGQASTQHMLPCWLVSSLVSGQQGRGREPGSHPHMHAAISLCRQAS